MFGLTTKTIKEMSDFSTELNALGEKISASRIESLTRSAIKLSSVRKFKIYSQKSSESVVKAIEAYIKKCTKEQRLGALYVIDSIARASMKLAEKDPIWLNTYGKLFPVKLGPLLPILFDCAAKEKVGDLAKRKEKMKRMVGLWIQTPKLFPIQFSTDLYKCFEPTPKKKEGSIKWD